MVRALDRRRLAAVALVTLLLSLGSLTSAALLEFFTPAELALAWSEHLVELAVLAAALTVAYTLLDEALTRRTPLRMAILCAMLARFVHRADATAVRLLRPRLRPPTATAALAGRVDALRRAGRLSGADRRRAPTRAANRLRRTCRGGVERALVTDESEQQLALLQAQIEPHFLFNVLGNVRRLYRTQPQAGSDTIASLMCYLRAALPQLRSQTGCLGDEFELVRAYLDLFQVRMGARLTFSLEADPTLLEAEFPPMLLITLVENAIKHGLEPAGGGRVLVRARRSRDMLEVAVLDDGAGFGGAANGGTGVGLANVRRQLAARYESQARLTLEARAPRGACATILIPLRAATTPDPRRRREPTNVLRAT